MTTDETRDQSGNTPESTEARVLELIEWIERRLNDHSGEHLFRSGWDGTLTADGGELALRLNAALAAAGVAPPAPSADREKLIASLRRVAAVLEEYEFEDHASEAAGLMNSAADALAAPAPVDEVKLAQVIQDELMLNWYVEEWPSEQVIRTSNRVAHVVREYLNSL